MNVEEFIADYGLVAIFFSMMSNGFFSAPPSELILPLAGIFSLNHNVSIFQTIIAAILGNLIGTYFLYLFGYFLGYNWLLKFRNFLLSKQNIAGKLGKILPSKIILDKLSNQLNQNGNLIICLSRCLPYVRSIISLPAGMIKMPHLQFIFYSSIGISIWTIVWQLAGYIIGYSWLNYSKYISFILAFIILLFLFFYKHKIKNFFKEYMNENNQNF